MHFRTLIFGILLLPNAATTMKCFESLSPGNLTDTEQDCPSSEFQCGAMKIASYASDREVSAVNIKSCVLAEQCVEGMVNFGITKTIVTTKCCTSDLCNSQSVTEPSKTTPNGKKCYYCDGQTCIEPLYCEGNEDRCISMTVVTGGEHRMLRGCASKEMCSNRNSAQVEQAIRGEISCCEGDYCNSANSTTAGLQLLVASLLPLVIFS